VVKNSMMSFSVFVLGACSLSLPAFSQNISPLDLLDLSRRTMRSLERNVDDLRASERKEIADLLGEIRSITLGEDDLPLARYEAICHIDDDLEFQYDQVIAGTLRAETIPELLRDCELLAKTSYKQNATYGIKDLRTLSRFPAQFYSANCHIDDDLDFNVDQIIIGTIYAEDVATMMRDCQSIAQATYRSNGSSGLVGINKDREAPQNMSVVECWLDDDPDFTHAQIFGGLLWGRNLPDVIAQCAELATLIYKNKGSSGIKIIRQ
jgi:hypothetical protein